jgi:site-specific recombinase XerD
MEFKYLERFINEFKIRWSNATTIAYQSDVKLFLEYMMNKKQLNNEEELLKNITNDDYEDWKRDTEGVYALTTVNRKITALALFFRYITVNKNMIEKNPMQGVEQIKINEKKADESPWKLTKEKDILTKEEVLKILEYKYEEDIWQREFGLCITRDKFLLAFESTTGVRISEATSITFDMIEEVEEGYMVNITTTKTNQRKRVPIANKCLKYFEDYMEYREHFDKAKNSDYLIVSSNGKKMTGNKCNENLNKLLTKIGITEKHITNHSNRKMFRTYATAKGVQENLIKLIGGWKLDKIASIYIKEGIELDQAKIEACNLI